MRGASSSGDIIDGTQVRVLQGLVDDLSVHENNPYSYSQDLESPQGAVGGVQLPESARALSAFRRPRD